MISVFSKPPRAWILDTTCGPCLCFGESRIATSAIAINLSDLAPALATALVKVVRDHDAFAASLQHIDGVSK